MAVVGIDSRRVRLWDRLVIWAREVNGWALSKTEGPDNRWTQKP